MKRIVICSDGTWQSPESDHPTNVLRLARAIRPHADDGVEQVVFYDWGVGADRKKLEGGLAGVGIDKNITDGYRFIVHNYDPGDELFFFGFSRGAYTVRSLGGFVRNCGILERDHADRIADAYRLYRKRTRNSHPNSPAAVGFRRAYAVANKSPIHFLGVWDTVGALGIPMPFLGTLGEDKYLFHDTEPSSIVTHARHAVSIDENREDFDATLWSPKPGLDLEQVWFAGVHGDVGGGYREVGLSDVAFRWMLEEAAAVGLAFEPYLTGGLAPQSGDKMHDEYKGIYKLRARYRRTIPVGAAIHSSVAERWETDPSYRQSAALRNLFERAGGDWQGVTRV